MRNLIEISFGKCKNDTEALYYFYYTDKLSKIFCGKPYEQKILENVTFESGKLKGNLIETGKTIYPVMFDKSFFPEIGHVVFIESNEFKIEKIN